MNKELFEALEIIEKERGIKKEVLLEKITKAMEVAVEKDLGIEGNVSVLIDTEKQNFAVSVVKTVVEEVYDPDTEITLEEAKKIKPRIKLGAEVGVPLKTKDFGYIGRKSIATDGNYGIGNGDGFQAPATVKGVGGYGGHLVPNG